MRSDLLYHGTSAVRCKSIKKESLIRVSPSEEQKLSLTPILDVALYWAELSAWTDVYDYNGDGVGCVLILSRKGLARAGYRLNKIHYDPVDEFRWEQEIACWRNVKIRSEILIDVQVIPISAKQLNVWRREHLQLRGIKRRSSSCKFGTKASHSHEDA
jgi:hypothetical protein